MSSIRNALGNRNAASLRSVANEVGLAPPLSLKALISALKHRQTVSFHQEVVTPSGTALGGDVDITFRGDGSFTFSFHMHDSGVPDYNFQVRAIFVASNGMTFVAQHSGHVEGTESTTLTHAPNRDNEYSEDGTNPLIEANWESIRAGKLWVTKEYSATGVIGFIEDLSKAVLDIAAGAVGTTLGVVIALGSEIGSIFGDLGIGGTFGVVAGVVVFAFGGGIILAVVAGVAVGLVTNALIKQRPISDEEYKFAMQVYQNSLPPASQIILTNLSGLGGRAFTMPGVDGKTYVNLGDAFDHPDPLRYKNDAYPIPGQVLIHELAHVWQIEHSSFLPGLVCEGIVNQANNTVGGSVYVYGPPGPEWSEFNLEQQGAIVDQWFAGILTPVVPIRSPMSAADPYFRYISDNIRAGRT